MVVLIAHFGGLVSLYAHLDDRIAPPRVGAGQQVQEGQIIGAIGELIDPLSLIAP